MLLFGKSHGVYVVGTPSEETDGGAGSRSLPESSLGSQSQRGGEEAIGAVAIVPNQEAFGKQQCQSLAHSPRPQKQLSDAIAMDYKESAICRCGEELESGK